MFSYHHKNSFYSKKVQKAHLMAVTKRLTIPAPSGLKLQQNPAEVVLIGP